MNYMVKTSAPPIRRSDTGHRCDPDEAGVCHECAMLSRCRPGPEEQDSDGETMRPRWWADVRPMALGAGAARVGPAGSA
jgi:nitrous oxide reductase accessory protein NosL